MEEKINTQSFGTLRSHNQRSTIYWFRLVMQTGRLHICILPEWFANRLCKFIESMQSCSLLEAFPNRLCNPVCKHYCIENEEIAVMQFL
jgi:hypothetical protein